MTSVTIRRGERVEGAHSLTPKPERENSMFDLMMQAVLVLSAGALGTCAISDMFSRDVLSRAGRHGRYADLNDFPGGPRR
jgi:hypothetical protein